MTLNRRELLESLGMASAASLLWSMGCRSAPTAHTGGAATIDTAVVRGWLHEAVSKVAGTFPQVRAHAVQRRRSTAAIDAIGAAVSRGRTDGVLIAVRDRAGKVREEVTSDLSTAGLAELVRAVVGPNARVGKLDFGPEPRAARHLAVDPRSLDDRQLRARAEELLGGMSSSRIVYASGVLDIDDATVWSVAPGRDLEQRIVRVRRTATRVAWNGTRPVPSDGSIGWAGGVDDQALATSMLDAVARGALELMTPSAFVDGEYAVVLEPSVAASAIEAITRTLFTTTAMRRPEVARRLAPGSQAAANAITLVDDPAVAGAYGGFAFDDEGELAAPITLIDHGLVAGKLGDRGRGLRPGHLGPVEVAPSHLRIAAGTLAPTALIADGFVLESARGATIDPSSGQIVIAAARAREWKAGQPTGRVFADVELIGDLGMLVAITAVATDLATITFRDDVDGSPRWRSIQTPSIAARGIVRGRRLKAFT